MQRRDLDITSLMNAYQAIESGESFSIEKIADVTDQRTFDQHASNLRPYEVIFGYAMIKEEMKLQVVKGPVRNIRDGAFNMTDPTSLVYPEVNGNLPRFSRIPADQQPQLEDFIAHRNPDWNIPLMQQVWNWVGLGTLIVEVIIFWFLLMRKINDRKSRQT